MSNSKINYFLDLNNIINFCFDSDEKQKDSEITETYSIDEATRNFNLVSKSLREVKNGDASTKQTVKYDMVKMLIGYLADIENSSNLTLGDSIILNTLFNNGFLIVENNEE